ncbi:MAG: lipase family protein [Sphingomonadales bacterium]|nr:MAG: lipase family protein [Sphingomonadales bacterium]
MRDCMKRRMLYAASQAYQPKMQVEHRRVGWIEPPVAIARGIDLALVGRVNEGVVIAFRGSLPPFFGSGQDDWQIVLDWLNASLSICVEDPLYGGGVHLGFSDSMRRLWSDLDGKPGVKTAVQAMLDQSLLDRRSARHLFVTGHSKGGALANLFAVRAARQSCWDGMPISVATIAAARAGNAGFAKSYAESRIACIRYELARDPVPHLPPGPQTPGFVQSLARSLFPKLATADYAAVGERVGDDSAGKALVPWAGARQTRRLAGLLRPRGFRLRGLLPAPLTAHAICPGSGYDRLICLSEADCDHGRDAPAAPVVTKPQGFRLRG